MANANIVWWVCVPLPLSILAIWGVILVARNWRQIRW